MREVVLGFAFIGPIGLPALLRTGHPRMRELGVFCITNLATFLPMVAMTLWLRSFPDPSCRTVHPGAVCDGIPTEAAWLFFAFFSGLLVVWGLLASLVATAFVFRRK